MRFLARFTVMLGLALASGAATAETIRYGVGPAGNWDTSVVDIGVKAGIFARHGLEVQSFYTDGSGQTLQTVLSGSVDIGSAVGTQGAMGAFAKGAPIRIIGAQATGASNFWYVRANSPIRSMADIKPDTTIGYSSAGASTHIFALGFVADNGGRGKPVATGSPVATLTQVMSGQIDVGWSSPPIGYEAVERGDIRIIAKATDVERIREQTIRTLVASKAFVESRPATLRKFLDAYRDTVAFMYAGDEAIAVYAEVAKQPREAARLVRDAFPRSIIEPDTIRGIPALQADAVAFKFLTQPLTEAQLKELIVTPATR